MTIPINPIFPVIAAQGAAAGVVLQPGAVIDAQVLKVLANDMVRIAIANLSIEVMSEIPLQPGQSLQLAVSQMPEGIRLAVVGQDGRPPAAQPAAVVADAVTLAPDAPTGAAKPVAAAPTSTVQLTALEALAVSAAAQGAATRQAGLSQLFANLAAAAGSGGLPPALQQAAMQVLAQRPALHPALSGNDIKAAFQNSGLFFEKAMATGAFANTSSGAIPDLKAVLIVFRQLLSAQLGAGAAPEPEPPQGQASRPSMLDAASAGSPSAAPDATSPAERPAPPLAGAPLPPDADAQEILLPQARVPVADDWPESDELVRATAPSIAASNMKVTAAATRMALNLMQEALGSSGAATPAAQPRAVAAGVVDDADFAHTNTPTPPVRGALPSAQPVALPTLPSGASISDMAHRLLQDVDGAIARQTLLQAASLPDRADAATLRHDGIGPRWNFEIPFATPLGAAVAQFEIAADGGGRDVEAAKRVWRARFSLDVEPAGPVHALVSLTGDTTSVRMWAERPATATRLRAGVSQLSRALGQAELTPGDIVIRDGAPPQTATVRAGHFLDRAM